MRAIVMLIVLICLLVPTSNVYALFEDAETVQGNKVNTHGVTVKPVRSYIAPSMPVLLQDLTQCAYATSTGELLCVDVCGGMSAPYSICVNY
jgi:hypothetical protein